MEELDTGRRFAIRAGARANRVSKSSIVVLIRIPDSQSSIAFNCLFHLDLAPQSGHFS